MTVKQQKMGLLSSSTEESTLAVSPSRALSDYFKCSTVVGSSMECYMHYQPRISPGRLGFQVDQSFIFFPLFTFISLQSVKYRKVVSGILMLKWCIAASYIALIQEPKRAECAFG